MGLRAGTIATLCGLLLALASAPAAQAVDPFYGVFAPTMSLPAAQVNAQLDAQAATGAGVVREHLHWDRIERWPGGFDWSDSDAMIAALVARGMTLMPVIVDTPQFYSTRPAGVTTDGWPPRDPASITRFATELTKRYGTKGTYWGCLLPGFLCRRPYHPIIAWQVWNEPDFPAWWRTGVDPAAYTALLRNAYTGLKAGDPKAEVVSAGLINTAADPGGYLTQLYDAGAAPYFDTVAIHAYGGNVTGVLDVVRRVRAIAIAKGDGGVPIRVTEYGFSTGGQNRTWVATPACQAALIHAVTQALSANRTALGIASIIEFQWRDSTADPTLSWPNYAGLLNYDGTAKPALQAFSDAIAGRPLPAGSTVPAVCPAQNQG